MKDIADNKSNRKFSPKGLCQLQDIPHQTFYFVKTRMLPLNSLVLADLFCVLYVSLWGAVSNKVPIVKKVYSPLCLSYFNSINWDVLTWFCNCGSFWLLQLGLYLSIINTLLTKEEKGDMSNGGARRQAVGFSSMQPLCISTCQLFTCYCVHGALWWYH